MERCPTDNTRRSKLSNVAAIRRQSRHNSGNVVIAEKAASGGLPAIKPLPKFAQAALAVSFVDLPLENDGVLVMKQSIWPSRTGVEPVSPP